MRRTRGLAGKFRVAYFGDEIGRDDSAGTGNDADLAGIVSRVIPGVFECLPADFQEQALLRVHLCRVFRRVAEETGVKHFDVAEHRRVFHVIGTCHQRGVDPRRD
jgi:hypothetical protein